MGTCSRAQAGKGVPWNCWSAEYAVAHARTSIYKHDESGLARAGQRREVKAEDWLRIQLRNSVHQDIEAKRDTKTEGDEDMTKRTAQKKLWKGPGPSTALSSVAMMRSAGCHLSRGRAKFASAREEEAWPQLDRLTTPDGPARHNSTCFAQTLQNHTESMTVSFLDHSRWPAR